ncbi:MAG: TolC family protein, partial [Planctomycetes bacterium]|nr:TolC family protein [Planctomycetota bacterium]
MEALTTNRIGPGTLSVRFSRVRARGKTWVFVLLLGGWMGGCASHKPELTLDPPDVSPTDAAEVAEVLTLDASAVSPMYTELLAVDLPSVVRVAAAQNMQILQARERVRASEGELESTIGAAFPAIVPTALFEHVEGTVRATEGNLVGVGFNTFQPSVAIQWVVNPGRVFYDILAAKKRLSASGHEEDAVILETLRQAVNQYYNLVLAQARVSAAHQGVSEAEELFRISRLRSQTGAGVLADELRAEARLAERRQDLVTAMRQFYDSSVALSVILHLDSSVTLIPSIDELPTVHLVREDIGIEELLGIAVTFRPDLRSVRDLVEAAAADKGSTWWGAFGPQFQAAYQYGGITGHANNVVDAEGIPGNLIVNPASSTGSFSGSPGVNGLIKEGILRGSKGFQGRDDQSSGFHDQQRTTASVGWRFSLSAFGDLKSAKATAQQAYLQAEVQLDLARAEVVMAAQASRANRELVGLANQQITAAQEALRLSEANLQAGAMTTLDVLQAQDAATQARLRYAASVVRYNQSQVNLLAALGLLDEGTLTTTPTSDSA